MATCPDTFTTSGSTTAITVTQNHSTGKAMSITQSGAGQCIAITSPSSSSVDCVRIDSAGSGACALIAASTGSGGAGVAGSSSGGSTASGVYGYSTAGAVGVRAECMSTGWAAHVTNSGTGKALYVSAAGTTAGDAMQVASFATNGAAIWAHNYSTTGSGAGIVGTCAGPGYAINASSTHTNGTALYATAAGGSGFAVHANHTGNGTALRAITGIGIGVDSEATGNSGTGVRGIAHQLYGIGVTGSASHISTGQGGYFFGGQKGVYATCPGTNSSYMALHAVANNGAKGAVIVGDVSITGTLTKTAGTFTIDHPCDPENKILNHSFVESPEMLNVYRGVAVADSAGMATVTLPAYFDALNANPMVQLTPMGAAAPGLFAHDVAGNAFTLEGAQPGQRVSWSVTGARKDAYALANPMTVEVDKADEEKGFYISPAAHGHGKDKCLSAKRHGHDKDRHADKPKKDAA